jgi:hypothetical protein
MSEEPAIYYAGESWDPETRNEHENKALAAVALLSPEQGLRLLRQACQFAPYLVLELIRTAPLEPSRPLPAGQKSEASSAS